MASGGVPSPSNSSSSDGLPSVTDSSSDESPAEQGQPISALVEPFVSSLATPLTWGYRSELTVDPLEPYPSRSHGRRQTIHH